MIPRWLPALALVPGLMIAQENSSPPSDRATPPPADAPVTPERSTTPDGTPPADDAATPPPADSPMQRFQLDPDFKSLEATRPPSPQTPSDPPSGVAPAPPAETGPPQ